MNKTKRSNFRPKIMIHKTYNDYFILAFGFKRSKSGYYSYIAISFTYYNGLSRYIAEKFREYKKET